MRQVDQPMLVAERFEGHRPHLRAVAYRMLGSMSEAEDAVQEAWLRLARADADEIENLRAWLTTVVGRICLNMLRSRTTRREDPLDAPHVPDPVVTAPDGGDPEYEVLVADAVGLALLVVLDALPPAERLAYVLHDMFAVPFEEIAPIVERSPAAARQLASRARRRVRAGAPEPDPDRSRQREVVDAFFAASRAGDFEALLGLLAPDVVLRADGGSLRPGANAFVQGAAAVAGRAWSYRQLSPYVRPVLVNGAAGVLVAPDGQPFSIMAFTVRGGRIVAIDALADPERLRTARLPPLHT
jgi:RNA polymerase sigma factor (sigma-70 family)